MLVRLVWGGHPVSHHPLKFSILSLLAVAVLQVQAIMILQRVVVLVATVRPYKGNHLAAAHQPKLCLLLVCLPLIQSRLVAVERPVHQVPMGVMAQTAFLRLSPQLVAVEPGLEIMDCQVVPAAVQTDKTQTQLAVAQRIKVMLVV